MNRSDLWSEYKSKIADAKRSDQKRRAESWLALTHNVLGQTLVPLTLRRLMLLEEIESPLLDGGDAELEDIISFLWICSEDFTMDAERAKRFRAKSKQNKSETLNKDLDEYLTDSFAFVSSSNSPAPDSEHFASSVVDMLASEYGWNAETILDMPLSQIFQLLASITKRFSQMHGKQHINFNPTVDKLKQEYLRQINKEN